MLCDYIAGWLSGVSSLLIGHPFDTIKTQQQICGINFREAVKRIIKHRGYKGFYRGLLTPLIATGTINAIFFGVYGDVREYLLEHKHKHRKIEELVDSFSNPDKEFETETAYLNEKLNFNQKDPNRHLTLSELFLSGAIAGVACLSLGAPTELIKTKLQSQMRRKIFKGPYHCMYTIIKDCGVKGLYRGIVPLACREVVGGGSYVVAYELSKRYILQYSDLSHKSTLVHAVGGASAVNLFMVCTVLKLCSKDMDSRTAGELFYSYGVAGVVAWMFCIPFDTIKSRMQADDHKKPHYLHMRSCAREIIRTDGIIGLYRGFLPCVARAIPLNATIYTVYEKFHDNFCGMIYEK